MNNICNKYEQNLLDIVVCGRQKAWDGQRDVYRYFWGM